MSLETLNSRHSLGFMLTCETGSSLTNLFIFLLNKACLIFYFVILNFLEFLCYTEIKVLFRKEIFK